MNRITIPPTWHMKHFDSEFNRVAGSRLLETFASHHGYWQLAVNSSFSDCQFLITTEGVFMPTRVLYGTKNAVARIQARFQAMPGDLEDSLIVWLDDLLIK